EQQGRSAKMRYALVIAGWGFLVLVRAAPAGAADAEGAFDGEWRTSLGTVTLKQVGNAVTGTYGNAGQVTLKGTVQGKEVTFEYQAGQAQGEAHWTLDDSGHAFHGGYRLGSGQAGDWEGWRPDPEAPKGQPADLGGLWLTDLGLMELKQDGNQVK